jgi:tRNA (guanine-N7-)-methyltransferase
LEALRNRPIRSFALRGGHMSEAQRRAYVDGMPLWGVEYRTGLFDWGALFENDKPVVLEIGFGMGETTAHIAKHCPDINFLACEVYTSGVGSLLKLIAQNQITNIRIVQHDAVEVLRDMVPDASLSGIHVYFPDPWHKARHNKRRLIQAPFVNQASKKLIPGGYWHCATDWQAYAEQMLDVLGSDGQLLNTATDQGYSERPAYRPETKFERRGLRLGHGVWDLVFRKK